MIAEAAYTVFFYVIGFGVVVLSLCVIFTQHLLRAAVALMAVLVMTAGLYIMLDAHFLAGVQILVYVGGIVVLIVFAIMLTRSADLLEDRPTPLRLACGAAASVIFLSMSAAVFFATPFAVDTSSPPVPDDIRAIGRLLLDYGPKGYVLPFEIISLLLLAAVLGGIVIARKIPAPGQPFTSGGDLPGEAEYTKTNSQREDQ